jgi:hypothetical protein
MQDGFHASHGKTQDPSASYAFSSPSGLIFLFARGEQEILTIRNEMSYALVIVRVMTNKGDQMEYSTLFPTVVLVARSQGERGQYGGRKAYKIYVRAVSANSWCVFMSWGKEEMPNSWMGSEKIFATEQRAVQFAWDKFYEKIDKGYTERVFETN